MWSLIVRRKTFLIALCGIAFMIFLVVRMGREHKPAQPLTPPNKSPFARSLAASGIIESVNENRRLAPSLSGLVKKVSVKPGQKVKAGEVLVEQDDRTLRGEYLVAKASLEKANARFSKVRALAGSEAISRDEKDSIYHDSKFAEATVTRLELMLDQLKLRAPIDGVVLQVNTRPGEYLSTPINTNDYIPPVLLGELGGLQIRADIDELDAYRVVPNAKAVAYLKGSLEKIPIEIEFVRIDPYVIPKKSLTGDNLERVDTRVLQVIFKTKGEVPVYPGQQVDVYLER